MGYPMIHEKFWREGDVVSTVDLGVRIRRASASDSATIVEFNRCLARESEGTELNAETIARGVARALRHPELCAYYVAEKDGKVVGQTMVTYEMTDWRDGLIFWIQSVYVRKESRGSGVFRALYQHVLAEARAGEGRLVRLYVEHENAAAIAVYERLGMKRARYHLLETTL